MTINNSAYDTTACSGFTLTKVTDELVRAAAQGGLLKLTVTPYKHSDSFDIYLVEGGNTAEDLVPFFRHPFPVTIPTIDKNKQVFALDVRNFGSWNPLQREFRVKNGIEYAWSIKRAILNNIWVEGRSEVLRDISPLPLIAYSQLIGQSVARRFALDPAEQMIVSVLAGFFYLCQFTDETRFSEMDMTQVEGKLVRHLRLPAALVSKTLNDIACIHSLSDLCAEIHKRVGNVALQDFNEGTLIQIVSGTWFGTNAREVLAVGLEHVPTWLAIVDASLSSATFRRSTLAKIIQQFDKNEMGKLYHRSIDALIGGPDAVTVDGATHSEYATYY